MLSQQQLLEIGETFKKASGIREGTVRVEFVAPDGGRDAVVAVARWKLAISELEDSRKVTVAMGQLVKNAKLKENKHGLWEVTMVNGEKFESNVLTHVNQKLN